MLRTALPPVELTNWAEHAVWVKRPAGSESRFPAMPRAMLTLSPPESGAPGVYLHALGTRAQWQTHAQAVEALGLVLLPETAAHLMGLHTGVVVDAVIPWTALAGPAESARLDDALHLAPNARTRLDALCASMARVMQRGPERVNRSRFDLLRRVTTEVGAHGLVAGSGLGWGERQLERRCRALLGLGPKSLQRLSRFHTALGSILREGHVPDAQTAWAAGYYDQSHLAREARTLAGCSLRQLLQEARADGPWWPLAAHRMAQALRR